MNKTNLTIIQGGYDPAAAPARRVFLSAEATDTRLMGVSALAITWCVYPYANTDEGAYHFHQFFYYDAEEYGLDSYRSLRGDDPEALRLMQKAMIGGLGGRNVLLTEREAIFLVQSYAAGSRALHAPLAEPLSEYDFLLQTPLSLSDREISILWHKICTPLKTPAHLIQYYLMRLMARDSAACLYLTDSGVSGADLFASLTAHHPEPLTFCKNTVEEHVGADGSRSYLCESLLEDDNGYVLAVFELTLHEDANPNESRIRSCQMLSAFRVSSEEAAMQLSRTEFLTCYDIAADPEPFDVLFNLFSVGFMLNAHETGRLFMEFKENNDHVNQPVFRLNEDVRGLYYVTDFGQLILAAYSPEIIAEMENRLAASPLHEMLHTAGRYRFATSVLYDFIDSGMEDFVAYAESIRED